MKKEQETQISEKDLVEGTQYIISSAYLYTGKISNPNGFNEHEFLELPRELETTKCYLTRLLKEGELYYPKSRIVTHEPGTPDHDRLIRILKEHVKSQNK